ncbi:MAG: HEAT repeat domain-containing protein [Planctomycetes bacterium]|nr:HEAT repeat domain-containing protein [Planctomycetota bacterium]
MCRSTNDGRMSKHDTRKIAGILLPWSPPGLRASVVGLLLCVVCLTWATTAVLAADDAGAGKTVEALISALKDSDDQVRKTAIVSLGKAGDQAKPAVGALVTTLNDEDADIRGATALALARIGDTSEPVVSGLIARLKDSDRDVRSAAALSLSRLGPGAKAAVRPLAELADENDKHLQIYAQCALAVLNDDPQPHIGAVAQCLSDPKVEVRGDAAFALGELGSRAKSAVPLLTRALKDELAD